MINQEKCNSLLGKYEWVFLAVVILLGLAIRLYDINAPLVESHQVRQAQTAMMARNLYEDNMNIFHTRLDIFGNKPGYIILEFPLMHAITALLYCLFGVHEIIGRLVSVAFSVGAMFLMFGLARQFLSKAGAFAAIFLFVFSPMNIFFSRAFMPEAAMMFFITGAVYFFLKWLDNQKLSLYSVAIIFAAFAGLSKPTACLIFIPIFTAWFLKCGRRLFGRIDFWLYFALSSLPFILWGAYANYFNARIPYCTFSFADSWLKIIQTRGMLEHWFSPGFYAFVGGSIIFLLLTPLGFIGLVAGVLTIKPGNPRKILYSWLGAIIFYFYVLAGINGSHIYYHLVLLPLAAIFFGFSVEWLLNKEKLIKEMFSRKTAVCLTAFFLFLIFIAYVIGYVKYFKYMHSNRMPYVLEVSEIIKKNFPEGSFVIDNESPLLTSVVSYYSHSKAQPFVLGSSSIADLEYFRAQGATILVTMETSYGSNVQATKAQEDFWRYLNEKYKPLASTEHYHIFDLRESANTK